MNKLKAFLVSIVSLLGLILVPGTANAGASVGCGSVLENTRAVWSSSQGYGYTKGNYCMGGGHNRLLYLKFQSDGNLVIYEVVTGRPLWSSNTNYRGNYHHSGYTLTFQRDGNVVIYNMYGYAVWALGIAPLRTKYDMILRDYDLVSRYNYAGIYGRARF